MKQQNLPKIYRDRIRQFLELNDSRQIPVIDSLAHQFERVLQRDRRATVCFIGDCAVGKSTLLNALIGAGTHILPSGGIGPMTALATTVRYGDTDWCVIWLPNYHPMGG